MNGIIVWIFVWFLSWSIFNYKFNWNKAKTYTQRYILTSLFFTISTIVSYYIFGTSIIISTRPIFIGFIISMSFGVLLSNYYPFNKHIISGKYFLISLVFDILFQQIMVVSGILVLKNYFESNYLDFYFGILFMLVHLPIIFLRWAQMRYFYLIATLFGGTIFSYFVNNYLNGSTYNFLLHYFIYICVFYYLKDERKM